MLQKNKIIIVGGGLSGLTLAYLLAKEDITATVLEASDRLGGRIQTVKGINNTPMEIGATWFSDVHINLKLLIEELGLKSFPQYSEGISLFQTKSFEPPQRFYIPESQSPSFRVADGTQKLIDTLEETLRKDQIFLNCKVSKIEESNGKLMVQSEDGMQFFSDKVIVCLPPQLAAYSICFKPELPDQITKLLPTVQTWMSGSIKFTVEYSEPFWRNHGLSGMLYSHAGIIGEMYDHTNFEESKFSFTGFLNNGASTYPSEIRKELVIKQLAELFGKQALNPLSYNDKLWTDKYIIGGQQLVNRPHQNNGHPLLQEGYLNGNLYFSNTETAIQFSGYMEGAVISAKQMISKLKL